MRSIDFDYLLTGRSTVRFEPTGDIISRNPVNHRIVYVHRSEHARFDRLVFAMHGEMDSSGSCIYIGVAKSSLPRIHGTSLSTARC